MSGFSLDTHERHYSYSLSITSSVTRLTSRISEIALRYEKQTVLFVLLYQFNPAVDDIFLKLAKTYKLTTKTTGGFRCYTTVESA